MRRVTEGNGVGRVRRSGQPCVGTWGAIPFTDLAAAQWATVFRWQVGEAGDLTCGRGWETVGKRVSVPGVPSAIPICGPGCRAVGNRVVSDLAGETGDATRGCGCGAVGLPCVSVPGG